MSETKHNGDLGDEVSVEWHFTEVLILDISADYVELDAKQALSLLAWLQQEKTTLEALAEKSTSEGH